MSRLAPLRLALCALLVTAVPATAQTVTHRTAHAEEIAVLTVTGEGEATAEPDMAVITVGVTAEEATAEAALDATSAIAGDILERLAAFDIAPRDVQTSNLSLHPVYTRPDRDDAAPRIAGFRASNMLSLRVRDLDRLGEVLAAVTGDGANELAGLRFSVSDPAPLLDAARAEAAGEARRKAEIYAEALGVSLGRVLSVTEQGGFRPEPMPLAEMRMASDAVPVARGETGYTATVTVRFELLQ